MSNDGDIDIDTQFLSPKSNKSGSSGFNFVFDTDTDKKDEGNDFFM